jgi:hypothetical protein
MANLDNPEDEHGHGQFARPNKLSEVGKNMPTLNNELVKRKRSL